MATLPSGSDWPGRIEEKTTRRLWKQNGLRNSVAQLYATTLYAFTAYCRHHHRDVVVELTADGAARFVRWYIRVQRLRVGPGTHASGALRAYAWALSAQGIRVPEWKHRHAKRAPDIVEAYLQHARLQRGLAESTLARDRGILTDFIQELRAAGGWQRVSLVRIERHLHRLGPTTVRRTACAIRGWLRFLFATGTLRYDLAALVVSPVGRAHDQPPRALPWSRIRKMLHSIDSSSAIGARDRAQFLLMSACGLGAAEVLQLKLSDIDWSGRRLHVMRQKTRSTIWLPLLPEVGRALANYIRHFRPRPTTSRHVFLSRRIPFHPFANSSMLRHRVREIAAKAGIKAPLLGTHIFRHSHATRHIVLGTPIKTLSDILGHRDAETTSIYTRAAVQRLRRLALPIPK